MSLSKGDKLKNGQYTIVENNFREGSYGIIHKAIDNFSKKTVAIKTLKKEVKHSEYKNDLKRFNKEIAVLKKKKVLDCPYIVRTHEDFKENESLYLVMEFLSENTLRDLVEDKGKLPDRLALDYIRQIGSALKALHNEDWVHRDVHPDNIMIVENKAVLIDFGIVGNPKFPTKVHPKNDHFAPYEQKIGKLDSTVDIYALAACLYYALTGQVPAASEKRKYENEVLIPPRKHDPSISQEVENAILKGMELEAEKRPQSIEKWLNLLLTTSSRNDPLSSNHASNYIKSKNVQSPRTNDDLRSACNIDYTRLRNLLAAKKWKEADKETLAVMLKATGTANENRLKESIKNLPHTDLDTINTLWVQSSNERFGFSVQKRIWKSESVACNYKKFRAQVGWKTFVRSKTQEKDADGHFPVQFAQKRVWFPGVGEGWVKQIWISLWVFICICTKGLVFLLWVGFMLYFEVREYDKSIVKYLLTIRMPD